MTLKFNSLFGQRDVRETATSTIGTTTNNWTCSGNNFATILSERAYQLFNGKAKATENDTAFIAPVSLPNGAVVTAAIVEGNAAAESAEVWDLFRHTLTTGTQTNMTDSSNIGTEVTSISNATIDNTLYSYNIVTSGIDTNDELFGAKITYTLN